MPSGGPYSASLLDSENSMVHTSKGASTPAQYKIPLSPKSLNTSNNDQIFQLQIEISNLKNRLKLSSSTQKNELLDLLSEKETVIQHKSKQLSSLNDKFHKITKAVQAMEHEVNLLRQDKEMLLEDNKKFKRHLNIREKEVTTLVNRCTAQEEKLMECKESRILEKQLQTVQDDLLNAKKQLDEFEQLKSEMVQKTNECTDALRQIEEISTEKKELSCQYKELKESSSAKLREKESALKKCQEELENLASLKMQQEVKCKELQERLETCQEQLKSSHESMDALRTAHTSEMLNIQNEMDALKQENYKLKKSLDMAQLERDELMKLKTKDGEELQQQLTEVKNQNHELSKAQQVLMQQNAEQIQSLQQLEAETREMEQCMTEMEQMYESKLELKQKETISMKEEYEGMLLESESQFKEQDTMLAAERTKITKLREEIEQMTSYFKRQEELRSKEVKLLEESVSAAQVQLDAKEVELIEKDTALRNVQSRVNELETTVRVLERESRQSESSSSAIIDELHAKMDECTRNYAMLEQERDIIKAEYAKVKENLQGKVTELETQFTDLKGELVSKDAQLEQRQATIDSLVQNKQELERKITTYGSEIETLMGAYDERKVEYASKLKKINSDKEAEVQALRAQYAELKTIATESHNELEKYVNRHEEMKTNLDEKSLLASEIQERNTQLQKDLSSKESFITELQDRWREHVKESEDIKRRSTQIRIEKEKEINKHIDALQEERSQRNQLESEIAMLKAELTKTKKEVKSAESLKAANYLLQDKIDRQNAYLQRKLAKESALKKGVRSAPVPSIKSPQRPTSARSSISSGRLSSVKSHSTRPSSSKSNQRNVEFDAIELRQSGSQELDELLEGSDSDI